MKLDIAVIIVRLYRLIFGYERIVAARIWMSEQKPKQNCVNFVQSTQQ